MYHAETYMHNFIDVSLQGQNDVLSLVYLIGNGQVLAQLYSTFLIGKFIKRWNGQEMSHINKSQLLTMKLRHTMCMWKYQQLVHWCKWWFVHQFLLRR